VLNATTVNRQGVIPFGRLRQGVQHRIGYPFLGILAVQPRQSSPSPGQMPPHSRELNGPV
jgi:hypothetical protein